MSHNDFAVEPVPGLPAALPAGEAVLWQGQPRWRSLALRALHARKVAIYFAVLAAWSGVAALYDGRGAAAATWVVATQLLLGALAAGMLAAIAYLASRATLYTITTARVVIRFGIALTMSVNLPFTTIQSAGLRRHRDQTGDIPLGLAPDERVSYLILWPHVRPWRIRHVQPMLRCIPDAEAVARLLADALARRHGIDGAAESPPQRPLTTSATPAAAVNRNGARAATAVASA